VPPDDPEITDAMWIAATKSHFSGKVTLSRSLLTRSSWASGGSMDAEPACAVVLRATLVDVDVDGAADGAVGAMLRLQARVSNVSTITATLSKARMMAPVVW
jgi:hypothetical protein